MWKKGFYLKRIKSTIFPVRFLFLDSETLKFREHDIDLHRMRLAITCYTRLDKTPYNIRHEAWTTFYTQKETCKYIDSITHDKSPLWIVTSNPKFDLGAIGFIKWFTDWNWKLEFIGERGLTFILILKNDKRRIKVIALQNYYTTGIAMIGKIVGLPKLDIDVFTDNMDELKLYCRRDTEILRLGFLNYLQFVYEHDLGNFALTKAAQSFNAYRKKFMKKKILIHKREKVSELERSSYHGGRVDCFKIGKQIEQEYVQLDINSMYAYVMQKYCYPFKLLGHVQCHSLPHLITLLKHKCVTARVLIDTNEPVYAKMIDNKCCFPTGLFWETLNTRALQYAVKNGHLKDVSTGVYYEKATIFKDYIEFFWNLRLKAQADKNYILEQLIKYMLNALYGKWAQQIPILIDKRPEKENLFEIEHWYNAVTKEYGVTRTMFHVKETLTGKHDSKNTFVSISAHITEDARLYLWHFLKLCGLKNVYYCDTDSLIVSRKTLNTHIQGYMSNKLGHLKIEKTSNHLLIHTLKDYELGDKIICKGVGRSKKLLDDNTYEVLTGYGLTRLLILKITDAAILTPIEKHLSRLYYKGTVTDTGEVVPFHLHEPIDFESFQIESF